MFGFSRLCDSGPQILPFCIFTSQKASFNVFFQPVYGKEKEVGREALTGEDFPLVWINHTTTHSCRQAEKCHLYMRPGKRGQSLVSNYQSLKSFPLIYQFVFVFKHFEINLPASSKEATETPDQWLHQVPIPESLVISSFLHQAQFLCRGLKN